MRPFWHPLSALLLTDPPSYATPGMIRMFLRAPQGLELLYAGDLMWPAVRQGQRVVLQPVPDHGPARDSVVAAEVDGIPDLLRVRRVSQARCVLGADADPELSVSLDVATLLGVADLPCRARGPSRLRRLFLDHAEACMGNPDDAPAATVLQKYDGQAPYYATSDARLQPSLLERLHSNVRSGGRVLVAGSGTGLECFALAGQGWQVTGIDFAPRMVELAQQENERRGSPVRFLQADLLEHEEPPASLAAVLFTYDVYSFLPARADRCRLLRRMSAWLEPDGSILLSARRVARLYERWILTLQWLRRGARHWGHSHTRWLSADGALHRSFVQVHGEASLAREIRQAGLNAGAWDEGHALLRPDTGKRP